MGRYTGPTDRLSRREGVNLFLKGERSYNGKSTVDQYSHPPGEHGQGRGHTKFSEYGLRLREKQKVKRLYCIRENQFRRYFKNAFKLDGVTGSILISMLERRLDSVVYRLGFGTSRSDSRQLITHKHILVNGSVVNIPSFQIKDGDTIEVKNKSKKLSRINQAISILNRRPVPAWLEQDLENYRGTVIRLPEREDVTFPIIDEQLIVEFYSRV